MIFRSPKYPLDVSARYPESSIIVPLLRASDALKRIRVGNDDQKTGVEIVRKALSFPARQIAINAGEDGSVIVGKILEKDQYAWGFDAQSGEYGNLVQKGNALYDDQEYEKAIGKYEEALKKTPSLGVIHHNLGLAYARLYRPGLDTPENKDVLEHASTHLKWWLDRHPNDTKVRKFLMNLWLSAADYQPVLGYPALGAACYGGVKVTF